MFTMLEQHAIVLKTEGNKAWVEAREIGMCGHCGTGGCSTRRLADMFGRRERVFPVDNVLNARVGDRVVIGIPSGVLWKSAYRLYGLPLVLMVAGALVGQYSGGDAMALTFFVAGLLLAGLLQKNAHAFDVQQPVMLRHAEEDCHLVLKR